MANNLLWENTGVKTNFWSLKSNLLWSLWTGQDYSGWKTQPTSFGTSCKDRKIWEDPTTASFEMHLIFLLFGQKCGCSHASVLNWLLGISLSVTGEPVVGWFTPSMMVCLHEWLPQGRLNSPIQSRESPPPFGPFSAGLNIFRSLAALLKCTPGGRQCRRWVLLCVFFQHAHLYLWFWAQKPMWQVQWQLIKPY